MNAWNLNQLSPQWSAICLQISLKVTAYFQSRLPFSFSFCPLTSSSLYITPRYVFPSMRLAAWLLLKLMALESFFSPPVWNFAFHQQNSSSSRLSTDVEFHPTIFYNCFFSFFAQLQAIGFFLGKIVSRSMAKLHFHFLLLSYYEKQFTSKGECWGQFREASGVQQLTLELWYYVRCYKEKSQIHRWCKSGSLYWLCNGAVLNCKSAPIPSLQCEMQRVSSSEN